MEKSQKEVTVASGLSRLVEIVKKPNKRKGKEDGSPEKQKEIADYCPCQKEKCDKGRE